VCANARDDIDEARDTRDNSRKITSSTGVVPQPMATNVQETASWSGNSSEHSWKVSWFCCNLTRLLSCVGVVSRIFSWFACHGASGWYRT
jgi:hypothetical protein